MLSTARRAREGLANRAGGVLHFVLSRLTDDGGFRGRGERADLYYTAFALQCLMAMEAKIPPATVGYIKQFGAGEKLDFVHLCCLARCRNLLGGGFSEAPGLARRLERYRCADGGFSVLPDAACGSAYGAFLATGAFQDMAQSMPQPQRLMESLKMLRVVSGGYANDARVGLAATSATAAAMIVMRQGGLPAECGTAQWLRRQRRDGGFLAIAAAPIPDLLSTATAIHALAATGQSLDDLRAPCRRFLDSLWSPTGGFRANQADETVDVEYTFYGLLAEGHLG